MLSGRNRPRNINILNPEMGMMDTARYAAENLRTPLAYMTPGVGDVMAHQDAMEKYGRAKQSFSQGDYGQAALHGISGFTDDLTTIPVMGDALMGSKLLGGTLGGLLATTKASKIKKDLDIFDNK